MSEQDDLVPETFRRYVRAFETLQPEAVLPYHHEASLFVSPEVVMALRSGADVAGFFPRVMAALRADGYAGSWFPEPAVVALSDTLKMVRASGSWKRAEATRVGVSSWQWRMTPARRVVGWALTIEDDAYGAARRVDDARVREAAEWRPLAHRAATGRDRSRLEARSRATIAEQGESTGRGK